MSPGPVWVNVTKLQTGGGTQKAASLRVRAREAVGRTASNTGGPGDIRGWRHERVSPDTSSGAVHRHGASARSIARGADRVGCRARSGYPPQYMGRPRKRKGGRLAIVGKGVSCLRPQPSCGAPPPTGGDSPTAGKPRV